MEAWWVSPGGLEPASAGTGVRQGAFMWVDVPRYDDEADSRLRAIGVSDGVLEDFGSRTVLPKAVPVDGRTEVVLHDLDAEGHLLELDMLVGPDLLVTVHGPLTEGVPLELATRHTDGMRDAIRAGELLPASPQDAAEHLGGSIAESLGDLLKDAAMRAGSLDRRLRSGETGDPEIFLKELFDVRHGLLTVSNRAAQSRQMCGSLGSGDLPGFARLETRFATLRSLCDGEKEFLQGVLDYYQSQTAAKMNIAMERLALIAALALPTTAIASLYGMNVIVSNETRIPHLLIVLGLVSFMTIAMFRWAKKQGWW